MENFSKAPELVFKENGDVFLHLPKNKHLRRSFKRIFIGHLFTEERVFLTAKKDDRHIYRLHNSISIPFDLINLKPARFLYICCPFNNTNIWISVLAMKKHGIVLENQIYGFERQFTLELSKWHKTRKQAKIERLKIKKGGL